MESGLGFSLESLQIWLEWGGALSDRGLVLSRRNLESLEDRHIVITATCSLLWEKLYE